MLRVIRVVLQKRILCIFYLRHHLLINSLLTWGIAGILATVVLGRGQIEYVASQSCGRSLGYGPAFVWGPALGFVIVTFIFMV